MAIRKNIWTRWAARSRLSTFLVTFLIENVFLVRFAQISI